MHISEYQVFKGLNSWIPVAYSSQVPIGQCCPNHWIWDTQSNLSHFGIFFFWKCRTVMWKWKRQSFSHVWLCNTMHCSPPCSSVHGIFQARILGCHSLLQGIFLTQGLNPGLWHCRQIIYQLSTREAHKRPVNKFQWLKNHLHCTYRTRLIHNLC